MRGEDLGFAQARGADADGTCVDECLRDFGTFVRLAVRPEVLGPRRQVRGHLADVVFERVEVDKQGWSGDVAAKLHERRMLARILRAPGRQAGRPPGRQRSQASDCSRFDRRVSRIVPGSTFARRASWTALRM
jgi:hypothetical protein